MDTMLVKKFRTLTAGLLMLGAVNQAQAVDFTGTLDLNNLLYSLPYEYDPVNNPGVFINVQGALDIDRYYLGNSLSGLYDILFAPGGGYNSTLTLAGFLISDNPNDAIVANPSLLAPAAADWSALQGILQGNWWAVWNVASGTTSNMRTLFTTPPQFTPGTDYYIFAAGGSVVPISVPYMLTVAAVPEPEVWAMMIAGLLMLFYQQFRRGRQQRLVLRST